MKKKLNGLMVLILGLPLTACELGVAGSTDSSSGSGYYCSTADQTDVRGVENDQWTQLDFMGDYQSQIHLRTVRPDCSYTSVQWVVGENRQTCSSGGISQVGSNSYLQISLSPTVFGMQVVPGWNYIDYQAYGCTPFDCSNVIETGTIVLYVNYVQ